MGGVVLGDGGGELDGMVGILEVSVVGILEVSISSLFVLASSACFSEIAKCLVSVSFRIYMNSNL